MPSFSRLARRAPRNPKPEIISCTTLSIFYSSALGLGIGTTEIYTHVSIVKLKQIHEMTHPTLHRGPESENEMEVTEEERLSSLESETEEDN